MNVPTPSGPYPSDLLNEVHRFFPALLYDTGRFNNLTDVFDYVRTQMRQNFDLFTNARHQYLQSEGLNTPPRRTRVHQQPPPAPAPQRVQQYVGRSVSTASTQPTMNTSPLRGAGQLSEGEDMYADMPPLVPLNDTSLDGALTPLITNWLTSILNPNVPGNPSLLFTTNIPGWGGQGTAANLFDPVIVRPSAAVLERATIVSVLAQNSDNNCAVCQDSMDQGATVRTINACGHMFHRTCVDTWFQTNVHCPTCRHDVRERSIRQVTTTAAAPSNTNAS